MTSPVPARCRAHGCDRELTDPVSRSRGYGPVCWANRHPAPAARHHLAAGPAPRRPSSEQTGPDLLDELDGTE